METKLTWAEFVKLIRKELDISQSMLAYMLGLPAESIKNWEYKGSIPGPLQRELLLKIYQNREKIKQKMELKKIRHSKSANNMVALSDNNTLCLPKESEKEKTLTGIGLSIAAAGLSFGLYKLLKTIYEGKD